MHSLASRTRGYRSRQLDHAERRARRLFDRARGEARRGLVYGPYLTADARCSVTTAIGGACTKLRRKFARGRPNPYRPPRGLVREFTRKSRTRLQQTLCAIPRDHVQRGMLFVTLTYPGSYPGAWALWKRQLDTWQKRLMRKVPRAAFVWKLEPQRRGAPHFHLLVVGVPFLAAEWLSRSWYEVVNSGDIRHLHAGTQVQLVQHHRGVLAYAAKYTAKHQDLPADWQDGVGRWWGVYGRARLGITWAWAPLAQHEYFLLVRVLRALIARRQRARGRAPPRDAPAGMWAVLDSATAQRLCSALFGVRAVAPDEPAQSVGVPRPLAAPTAAHGHLEPMPVSAP